MKDRISQVRKRINQACQKAGRLIDSVKLVAVSKAKSVEAIEEAYHCGLHSFGENYVQESLSKVEAFARPGFEEIQWHFIGALQSNKANKVVGKFNLIHSLDRWSLAKELEKFSQKMGLPVRALIEVNIAEESSKSGVPRQELEAFAKKISNETNIQILGLMAFPPLNENPEVSRPYFRKAFEAAQNLQNLDLARISGKELSMGVTSDYEVAIEEGATIVRVGTAIFGIR